jgi:prenyltransferase beta subunit
VVRAAGRWLARQANPDGGFNFAGRGGPSGIDDTGAAIQGLAAAGRRRTLTVRRAARFVVTHQNPDGGFPLQPGAGSNAQSTAWAVQGLLAARRDPRKVHQDGSRNPLAYLRSLTSATGEVRYSRTSRQTPVWVTAQVVMALAHKPLPLAPVPRAARARPRPVPTPVATAAPTPAATPARARPARRPRPAPTPAPTPVVTPAPDPVAAALVGAASSPTRARQAGYVAGIAALVLM